MLEERIVLDMLTKNSVSVVKYKAYVEDGEETQIGMQHRRAYDNSEMGIEDIKKDLQEPYLSTVLNLWGVTP